MRDSRDSRPALSARPDSLHLDLFWLLRQQRPLFWQTIRRRDLACRADGRGPTLPPILLRVDRCIIPIMQLHPPNETLVYFFSPSRLPVRNEE